MSRTAAPAESTHESFFGLLEQMTENARSGPKSPEYGYENISDEAPLNLGATSNSRRKVAGLIRSELPSSGLPGSGFDRDLRFQGNKADSIPPGDSRSSRSRNPASNPAPESKAGRAKLASETSPLSYEKALRIHGRRRLQDQSDFDPPSRIAAAPEAVSGRKQTPSAATALRDESAAKEHAREAAPAIAKAILEAKIQIAAQRAAVKLVPGAGPRFIPEVSTATNPTSSPVSRSVPRSAQRQSASAGKKAAGRIASNPSNPSPDPLPSIQTSKAPPAQSQRPPKSAPIAAVLKRTSYQNPPRQSSLKTKGNLEEAVAAVSDRQELAAVSHHLALEQRRSIVSIRLNDSELDILRIRAAECGISVSAYMRSCVLDAEHLRTQVKQALSQMRACSGQPEPIHLAVTTGPANGNTIWFRQVFRYMAFLFGPLFAIRRSA
jgi:hypothetical protein